MARRSKSYDGVIASNLPRSAATAQQSEGKRSTATAKQPAEKWSHVQVVTYASGLTGFFDTRTGKLFLYDANLDEAVFIREIDELGKRLKKLKN